jgi:hypothetical protein
MAKRGRPSKDDPRHVARKAQELEKQLEMQRLLSGRNRSGLPNGVNKTDTGMFQARISLHGKRYNLGSFESAEEAAEAYNRAKAAGFTSRDSPQKYAKRGTGKRFARDSNSFDSTSRNVATCDCILCACAQAPRRSRRGCSRGRPMPTAGPTACRASACRAARRVTTATTCRSRWPHRSAGSHQSRSHRGRSRRSRSRRSRSARSCRRECVDAPRVAAAHCLCARGSGGGARERRRAWVWIDCG